ncbi:uncharacterized protein LOC102808378 [Saccoglossus kowalevskii]|uniref:Tripartite motif-containing protein 2-like n=1 Tax=Saccoglossus kowalevskii TaxID=10224 RepID=A0ABM0M3B7_SACKO|nr:PREDICTED: tripartite motif-containing protein 2-like [Saccoglossus kowalevskii]
MSLSRQLLLTIGETGNKEGQLKEPCGLTAWTNGEVVVADRGNSRIQVFDRHGHYKYHFTYNDFKRPFDPIDVAITRDDSIMVTDYSNCKIVVFDRNGQMIDQVGHQEIHGPWGITVKEDGSFYVVDRDFKSVVFYDMYGTHMNTIGGPGKETGDLRFPLYAATSQDGNCVYVTDSIGQAVKVYDSHGTYMHQLSVRGQKEGQIFWPTGVAVDRKGNVIVAEFQDVFGGGCNRLQRFQPDGVFVDRIDDKGNLSHPLGLAVSSPLGNTQRLYVSDWGHDLIKVYQIYIS